MLYNKKERPEQDLKPALENFKIFIFDYLASNVERCELKWNGRVATDCCGTYSRVAPENVGLQK
jgi:hypothetical protein